MAERRVWLFVVCVGALTALGVVLFPRGDESSARSSAKNETNDTRDKRRPRVSVPGTDVSRSPATRPNAIETKPFTSADASSRIEELERANRVLARKVADLRSENDRLAIRLEQLNRLRSKSLEEEFLKSEEAKALSDSDSEGVVMAIRQLVEIPRSWEIKPLARILGRLRTWEAEQIRQGNFQKDGFESVHRKHYAHARQKLVNALGHERAHRVLPVW